MTYFAPSKSGRSAKVRSSTRYGITVSTHRRDAALARPPRGGQRLRAGSVDDVYMRAGKLRERRQVMDPLGLDRRRARRFVPFRPGLPFGEQAALKLRDDLRIFAMGGDDDAQPPGQFQRAEQLRVVDAEGALVGEEDLERRGAVGDDAPQHAPASCRRSASRPCERRNRRPTARPPATSTARRPRADHRRGWGRPFR